MPTAVELQEQINALQAQLEEVKAREVVAVVERMKREIATYGITADMLGFPVPLKPGRKPDPNSARSQRRQAAAAERAAAERAAANGEAAPGERS
jgi:hypothetical protein